MTCGNTVSLEMLTMREIVTGLISGNTVSIKMLTRAIITGLINRNMVSLEMLTIREMVTGLICGNTVSVKMLMTRKILVGIQYGLRC